MDVYVDRQPWTVELEAGSSKNVRTRSRDEQVQAVELGLFHILWKLEMRLIEVTIVRLLRLWAAGTVGELWLFVLWHGLDRRTTHPLCVASKASCGNRSRS